MGTGLLRLTSATVQQHGGRWRILHLRPSPNVALDLRRTERGAGHCNCRKYSRSLSSSSSSSSSSLRPGGTSRARMRGAVTLFEVSDCGGATRREFAWPLIRVSAAAAAAVVCHPVRIPVPGWQGGSGINALLAKCGGGGGVLARGPMPGPTTSQI